MPRRQGTGNLGSVIHINVGGPNPPPCFGSAIYVNETCATLPLDQIQPVLDHLNRIELCVQFIVEEESDGRLVFLDVQAEALSSSGVEWAQEEKEISGTLKENGYPNQLCVQALLPGQTKAFLSSIGTWSLGEPAVGEGPSVDETPPGCLIV